MQAKDGIPGVIRLNAIKRIKDAEGSEDGALATGQIVTKIVWQQRLLESAIARKNKELELLAAQKG